MAPVVVFPANGEGRAGASAAAPAEREVPECPADWLVAALLTCMSPASGRSCHASIAAALIAALRQLPLETG
ncbi:hypothetical protein JQ557_10115 [Bradyrhizobium sp. U87765 SZCCT0131]|uniref:hypothetical protein n=1 Tax=unclassified Bradyrhizobium TaxID=2631580 RepID=UPI001BA72C8C|nr:MULTISPECIES: hypothetical protein [unclassified Bradyrhizobium]MBR1218344.1 hypothetical protein [Bradyrhizobium sp. U87765 SZCCT0131]MBR1260710.1 hypothetical protein [Bradyrhizobium sp. U87765 SZCCT0134]MBR1303842.1 hypothetical protein [Bradyrhizobium sp. U87765 SZCCT0110]MBR1319448.1 hypothetical protein [Bradyrhizobium sp. U87765 SZCCT0109]MBR1347773.1 hypothetical protein [Bradyrhizobium sp. U87765 SZCCT0048]